MRGSVGEGGLRGSLRQRTEVQATGLECRSCGRGGLTPVLSLGSQPLANALRGEEDLELPEPSFPLALVHCRGCSLLQLTESVPPEVMFSDYPYFSSVIPGLVEHGRALASRTVEERDLGPGAQVIEIASNDGYLLQHYRDAGVPVVGIEPAQNIAEVAESKGIPTRVEFFGRELAERLRDEGIAADVMHAHNVLAHVPDPNGFVAGIALVLKPTGRAIIEVPYVRELLLGGEFDTIYHEHLFYYSLTALSNLFERHDLVIEDVERIAIHGGSLRLFVAHRGAGGGSGSTEALLAEERGWEVASPEPYLELGEKVEATKAGLRELLGGLKAEGATIAAYGAAAKGSTLLNTFEIGKETLDFVVDLSPHKQGRFMPGSGLPVVSPERLVTERPDYVLILAWNFAEEILEQQRSYREAGGRFIVPVPEPRML